MKDLSPSYDVVELTVDGFILRDEDSDEDQYIDAFDWAILPDFDLCVYCSHRLVKVEGEEQEDGRLLRDYCLWYCRNCRFWQSRIYSDPYGGCMPGPDNLAYISKLREFSGEIPDGCSSELASFIRRNPDFLHSCNPTKFEKLVADIFRTNFKNSEVIHVGKPDDGGIDIVMVDSDTQQWLIQVKRRGSENASEGVATIRDMLGSMILNDAARAIVVSNVNQFSLRAKQAADKAKSRGLTIRLVDKGILNRMLEPILPDRPWLEPIRSVDKILAARLEQEIRSDPATALW